MSITLNLRVRILALHRYLTSANNLLLITIFVTLNFILSYLFSIVSFYISKKVFPEGIISFTSAVEALVMAVIVAPLLETLVFQLGIIETIKKKRSIFVACLISALFFAVFHLYNAYYFAFTFVSGLMMAYLYCLKKSVIKGFVVTAGAHACYNLLGFLLSRYLK